jgi:MSHA biogenesis protein MshL
VLIEATIVEVTLSDRYQAGIDWSVVRIHGEGFEAGQNLGGFLRIIPPESPRSGLPEAVIPGTVTSFILNYINPDLGGKEISIVLDLLRQFGDVQVLSSPKIMALNNQMAVLKVVENVVYFDVDVEPAAVSLFGTQTSQPAVDTQAQTVPVGLVMTVAPQIDENDQIILNVRPTISSIVRFVEDPNPELRRIPNPIPNQVPQIQVREIESMLKLNNGQVAILGGLIQDTVRKGTRSVPLLSDLPFLGDTVFKRRDNEYAKTELVIFLRPVVIRNPSINADLGSYRPFLHDQPPATGPRSPSGGDGL